MCVYDICAPMIVGLHLVVYDIIGNEQLTHVEAALP